MVKFGILPIALPTKWRCKKVIFLNFVRINFEPLKHCSRCPCPILIFYRIHNNWGSFKIARKYYARPGPVCIARSGGVGNELKGCKPDSTQQGRVWCKYPLLPIFSGRADDPTRDLSDVPATRSLASQGSARVIERVRCTDIYIQVGSFELELSNNKKFRNLPPPHPESS